ncbi:MAG: F0F1 ATP synthase subunit A [Bacteroidota bacterium]
MVYRNNMVKRWIVLFLCFSLKATYAKHDEDPIMGHLANSYEWHFATIGQKHITLHLPVIVYKKDSGLHVFSSKNLRNADHQVVPYKGFILKNQKVVSLDGTKVYDISITKNVASMLLSLLILLLVFLSLAGYYRRNQGGSPRGGWVILAYLIDLVRNDIVKPNIDQAHRSRFTPYLLTLFFFIWINNFMGLLPGGANVTGNVSVTFVLAFFAFLLTNLNGSSYYWKHIFYPSGVPKWVMPILVPIEFLGIFTKPFTLMLRLFANMLAGHLVLLNIICLIFVLNSILAPIISVPLGTFMFMIKLVIAFFQAYIFVFLLAKYLGAASHTKSVKNIDSTIE